MTTSCAPVPLFLAVTSALLFAGAAGATWLETGDVTISILTPSIQYVEASEVQPGDIMNGVHVGSGLYETTGEVTVVGEGSGAGRKQLGLWSIEYGTGNVQSVVGTVGVFWVGESAAPTAMPGVLHILNSDIDGGGIRVYKGTLTVDAGSKVQDVEVFDEASAYVTLGSQIRGVTTYDGGYASIKGSIATGGFGCSLGGTVLFEDSVFRCRSLSVIPGGIVDIGTLLAPHATLDITNELKVYGGSLDVWNTIATTGSLVMGADHTDLGIAGSTWTNAGGLEFQPSSVVGPVEMTVAGASYYHDLGTARVSGHPGWQHLTVTGENTEFEVDGDLRIGEYISQNKVKTFSGNVTVADGATLIVHGELAIKPLGVLNLEPGGTVYAGTLANEGTINENGGTLVLPEAGAVGSALTAIASFGALSRRRTSRSPL